MTHSWFNTVRNPKLFLNKEQATLCKCGKVIGTNTVIFNGRETRICYACLLEAKTPLTYSQQ